MNTNFSSLEKELGVSFILKDKGLERLDEKPKINEKLAKEKDPKTVENDNNKTDI